MTGSGSAGRGRSYRGTFLKRYGITYGEARRLSRVLYGTPTAPARAARAAASSRRGIDFVESGGPLTEVASRAISHRGFVANAVADVRAGIHDVRSAETAYAFVPGTLRTQFPSAVDARGRVRRADREPVVMQVLTRERGSVLMVVRGSRKRSLVGRHNAAVAHFKRTGDTRWLDALEGQRVGGLTLETDPDVIETLDESGALPQGPYPQSRGVAA
jgi:hypothetical protein